MELIVKGFTTKGELKELAKESPRFCVYPPASIYLEAAPLPCHCYRHQGHATVQETHGEVALPNDGTFTARPLTGKWQAIVSLRRGQIVRVC